MTISAQERIAAVSREPLKATGRTRGWSGALKSIQDIWDRRELLGLLVRRELRARYKDSALGFFWSLVRPLTMLLVYYVAIGKFLGGERAIPSFAIFVFTGLTAWSLFSDIVAGGTGSIVGNGGLVKKIYLPREVFPLSVVGSALFNFAIQLGILIVATVVLQEPPQLSTLYYAPLAAAVLLVFGLALALTLSALNVFLRDVQYLVEVVLMVAMWASPIVYSWALVDQAIPDGFLKDLYLANPVTLCVLGFQRTFWAAGAGAAYPDHLTIRLLIALGISLVLLVIGHRVFARLEGNFAQEL
ncbi:ABC transporter permease [Cellulomonas humilata]|uniref:Transport permease protein n=1 Tax=Cellulomonas humilata TaxID=144055 RepID=A0A7Y5ZZ75_9CELL|nr:ABC transporter permease [Cellulomonas humilata]NUU16797.1 ABC transporter permease [Cellulomonas humilata]